MIHFVMVLNKPDVSGGYVSFAAKGLEGAHNGDILVLSGVSVSAILL